MASKTITITTTQRYALAMSLEETKKAKRDQDEIISDILESLGLPQTSTISLVDLARGLVNVNTPEAESSPSVAVKEEVKE